MRRFLGAGLITLFLALLGFAQTDRTNIYTQPIPPAREALARLNLKLAWYSYVQMDGKKDAIVSIRLTGKHLLVQTRSGLVTQLDGETGQAQWRNRVGSPYQIQFPLTYNSSSVFILNNNYLFSLDRADGTIQYQMALPGGIAAPPIADEEFIYLPTVRGRLRIYRLPNMDLEKDIQKTARDEEMRRSSLQASSGKPTSIYDPPKIELPTPGQMARFGPQPNEIMAVPTNMRIDYQPMLSRDVVALPSAEGKLLAFSKPTASGGSDLPVYRFEAEGEMVAPPGQFKDTAYLGSQDANVYAIDMTTGRVLWRNTAGSAVNRQPYTTNEDLYVTSGNGLSRLNRTTGEPLWSVAYGKRTLTMQPSLDRVLAVNPKFVYATDRSGRLAVVDRIRGTILSVYDLRDFVFLTPNEWNDRIYLAAQNGLIISLHDREYTLPYSHQEVVSSLAGKLKRPVTIPDILETPLKDVLRQLGIDNRVKIMLSSRAFKEQGLEPIDDKPVKMKKLEGVSLQEALQKILEPFEATAEPIGEALFIVPRAKGGDKPPEKDMDKDKDKDKEKDKDKDKDAGKNM